MLLLMFVLLLLLSVLLAAGQHVLAELSVLKHAALLHASWLLEGSAAWSRLKSCCAAHPGAVPMILPTEFRERTNLPKRPDAHGHR